MSIIKLYSKNNPPERIDDIVKVLNDGGVIIYPTDTTYALGCHALKERAVEKICHIRDIDPASHPLSVICYDMSSISEYAHISTPVYKVMKRNLPGAFTFILAGKNKLPKIFRTKKSGEIGIRMPNSTIVRDILRALDAPMMTASLPIDGFEDDAYRTDPELIDETFGNQVDFVIDGGLGSIGESTIVDCRDDEMEIIRQGIGELR
ncbi:MAG: L-threonylcarbamoyladenylate synthase [Prevotellamassilia sp.]|jgi:tRNA threonylcarbamoyl adenosine modification protein (Sua5/YciO/YrdC/YwlC family)|nr:L-threonylcarbamoyladenylate synthase [Prevotellamassilia sp.]